MVSAAELNGSAVKRRVGLMADELLSDGLMCQEHGLTDIYKISRVLQVKLHC